MTITSIPGVSLTQLSHGKHAVKSRRQRGRRCKRCRDEEPRPHQMGFCSPECRFLFKARVAGPNECWPWLGAPLKAAKGYGRIDVSGVRYVAHRYAHVLFKGPIPNGYEVDHLCRNTSCVNPAHLEAVTPEEHDQRSASAFRAMQSAKTHCPKGHAYVGANIRRDKNGKRHCRACDNQRPDPQLTQLCRDLAASTTREGTTP